MNRPPEQTAELIDAGADAWQEFQQHRGAHFHPFVPADYVGAARALAQLKEQAHSFLELGSGVGVITILADQLGYDAYGIEIDPWLVQRAQQLADDFDSSASFIEGSFVPESFRQDLESADADYMTIADGEPAYTELGMDLGDFDLVYMFPWPDEEETYLRMVQATAPDTPLLTYDGTEGYRLLQHGNWLNIT